MPSSPTREPTSSTAFEGLLLALDPDRHRAGERYETLRRKLVRLFGWRGCRDSEECADETLDRVARRLDRGEAVDQARAYCFGVARRVLLEWHKERAKEDAALGGASVPQRPDDASAARTEARIACLEKCLDELPAPSRALIIEYYQGPGRVHQQGRKVLASRLGLSDTALKARAHRIRVELEGCLGRCLKGVR